MLDNEVGARYESIGPGRVNLLGEHIDYNDGLVLPAAIDRQITVTAEVGTGNEVTIKALDLDQEVTFSLDDLDRKVDSSGQPLPEWARYPAGVAWSLQKHGLKVTPIRGAFTSNIPMGSGLSSSAALEVAFGALWQELGGWEVTRLKLAQLCQEAEVRYVGVNCGLMDQFASANGVEGHALLFDVRDLSFKPVPLPSNTALVIADSTMRRSLSNSAYNERRAQCEEAVRLLSQYLPGIRSLRDVSVPDFYKYYLNLPEVIRKRAQYVVDEIARVEQAMIALKRDDAFAFGLLMYATHNGLRDLYEVSIPELDTLVEIARTTPGCFGARLTGAGFGGCTVNLVQENAAERFIEQLKTGYKQATGRDAQVYLCHASAGARARKIG